jgi:molecular chaperone GrpE
MPADEKDRPAEADGEAAAESGAPPEASRPPAEEPQEDWGTRYRYLLAEFDNFRKRVDRDRDVVKREAQGRLLRSLLPLYEAFHRARESAATLPASDPLRRGLELLGHEWDALLRAERVRPVAVSGERFRPEDHEAVGETPATPERPEGTIVEVVQQGYRHDSGLLRPAKVIVARAESPETAAEESAVEAHPESAAAEPEERDS